MSIVLLLPLLPRLPEPPRRAPGGAVADCGLEGGGREVRRIGDVGFVTAGGVQGRFCNLDFGTPPDKRKGRIPGEMVARKY